MSLPEPCRIYAPDGELFALVDEIDFAWVVQWRWTPHWSRGGTKVYMRRTGSEKLQVGTRTVRFRRYFTIWLHREVLIRSDKLPPSPLHVLADHENGDELDCRRDNLRWFTHDENNAVVNRRVNGTTLRRRLGL